MTQGNGGGGWSHIRRIKLEPCSVDLQPHREPICVLWACRECRAVISHLPYIQKNLCLYPSRIGFKTSIIFLHLLHKNKLIIHMFSYPGGPTAPSFQWEIVHICGLLSISLEYTHTHRVMFALSSGVEVDVRANTACQPTDIVDRNSRIILTEI